jgi:pimeloyl-ACP methyl ester carboxylesterase
MTGYAPVNGLQMYYEIYGEGKPLVLIHGAFNSINVFNGVIPGLAKNHKLYCIRNAGAWTNS